MRPPICTICDRKFTNIDDGGLIYFKKRKSNIEWDEYMEKKGYIGHPPYIEWFYSEHYDKANKIKELTIDKTMKMFKKR